MGKTSRGVLLTLAHVFLRVYWRGCAGEHGGDKGHEEERAQEQRERLPRLLQGVAGDLQLMAKSVSYV